MTENFLLTIQITLAGMGVVFLVLVLLWGFMALLVRVTSSPGPVTRPEPEIRVPAAADQLATDEVERKKRVALIAAAIARAEMDQELREFPIPPTVIVSPWQAVNRSRVLNKRGFRR
jgi:sodium pump decarboxylase gamma subunit